MAGARTIEGDYLVEDDRPHIQEGLHLCLKSGRHAGKQSSTSGRTYAVIIFLLLLLLRFGAGSRITQWNRFIIVDIWFWRVVVGRDFGFIKGDGVHSNAVCFARRCDAGL